MKDELVNQSLLDSAQLLTDEMMEQIENGDQVTCSPGCTDGCKKNCKTDGRGTTTISPGDVIIGGAQKQ